MADNEGDSKSKGKGYIENCALNIQCPYTYFKMYFFQKCNKAEFIVM